MLIFCTIRELERLDFESRFHQEGSFLEINCIKPFFSQKYYLGGYLKSNLSFTISVLGKCLRFTLRRIS